MQRAAVMNINYIKISILYHRNTLKNVGIFKQILLLNKREEIYMLWLLIERGIIV